MKFALLGSVASALKHTVLGVVVSTMFAFAPAQAIPFFVTGTLDSPDDFSVFGFSLGAPTYVEIRSLGYAGGTNYLGNPVARGGFDEILSLFDGAGNLLDVDDDGGFEVPPDDVTGARFDSLIRIPLEAGFYSVAVSVFGNFPNGPNFSDGFQGGGNFTDVTGDLRSANFAFQITVVPEPATWAMLIAGFGIVGLAARRRARTANA